MTLRIGRTTLLVHDVDEAVAFYVDKLGFTVLPDLKSPGTWAALAGPGSEQEGALWFIPTTASDAVGNQTDGAPLLTLYTDDLDAEISRLEGKGVVVTKALAHGEAYLHDLYGNQLVIVDRPEAA